MKQSIKRISAVLAMAMALSAFSAFGVFAEGESTAPASVPQSTSVVALTEGNENNGSGDGSGNEGDTPTPVPNPVVTLSSYTVDRVHEGGSNWAQTEHADLTFHFASDTVIDLSGGNAVTVRMVNNGTFTGKGESYIASTSDGMNFSVSIPNVTYEGGGALMELEITLPNQGVTSLSQTIAQCHDVNPYATPAPTAVPEPTAKPEYDYPKILVKDFSFGGNSVEAGKEFTLELTLFTTSGNANLQDVMVGLNFGELKGVSLASGSMNTYVGEMAPNTTKTISYKMITDATIEPGAISINVNLTSKNGEAATAPISIPVTQPERFDITNMEAPETIMMGEEGYLSVTFVNKGKSAINNLSAEIQGDNLANPGQSQFLGNIAAGTENSVDFSVLAAAEGTINGKVILSYEDAKGEVKTLEKEFSCTVEPMMDMGIDPMDPGMMDPTVTETAPGMPVWGWVLIVVGVAAVVVVVVVVVKKKQKAKKLAQLEDEDEDI